MSRTVLLALAFCVVAVAASTAFDSSLGYETTSSDAVEAPLDLLSLVGPNAAMIWNKTENDVGKVTDIEENMGKGDIVLGSTGHKPTVTVVDLFDGKILAQHAPGHLIHSYSVETSVEGALVVLGCPEHGVKCHIFSFPTLDPSKPAHFEKELDGNLLHTHHALKLSDDGKVMAIVTLNERPHKHVPVPGKLHWLKGSDGSVIGEATLTRTLGEVFIDMDHGTKVATRQFAHEHDGVVEVYDTLTNKKIQSIPDRFSRFGVSPSLHDVVIPKTGHEHSFDVHSATTGQIEWSYSSPSGEVNNGLTVGRASVIASYFRHHGVPEFVFRVFALVQSAKVGVPHLTFNITLPHHAEAHGSHFVVSDDHTTSELAFAVPGVGIYHAPITGAHATPELLFAWPDRCGFHAVKIVRHQTKGTVVVAALNRRHGEGCSYSTDVVALNTPLRR